MPAPIRAVISDLDGVVYRGDTPIPGAVEAIAAWRARGIPYVFVTNNASRSPADFARKLNGMGVEIGPEGVLTASEAAVAHVAQGFAPGTPCFLIGEPVLSQMAEQAGLTLTESAEAGVVLLGFDYGLSYDKLRTAARALLGGAALVVTNPDILSPSETGAEPCVGATLAALLACAPETRPVIAGKPSPVLIHQALARLGTRPEETIMVGDQIVTDILAGQAAGLRSYLVTTGIPARPHPGTRPEACIASLLDLPVG